MKFASAVIFSLSSLCAYGVVIDSPELHDTNWVAIGTTAPDTPIDLVLAVKQQNVDGTLFYIIFF